MLNGLQNQGHVTRARLKPELRSDFFSPRSYSGGVFQFNESQVSRTIYENMLGNIVHGTREIAVGVSIQISDLQSYMIEDLSTLLMVSRTGTPEVT